MTSFFREIRKRLLGGNRVNKYLIYAIGEILLVVFGILIALQVNNWNETRLERKQEQAIMRQLKTEFTRNLNQLDDKIQVKQALIRSAKNLFDYIDQPAARNRDSIDIYLSRTIPFSTFDPIVNDLASSGSLRLIRSDSLKLMLSLWTSDIENVQEDELSWKFYRDHYYLPFLVENYQLRTIRNEAIKSGFLDNFLIGAESGEANQQDEEIGPSRHKTDFNLLLEHPDFEDHLERALSTNKFALAQSRILRGRILEILNLLDTELTAE